MFIACLINAPAHANKLRIYQKIEDAVAHAKHICDTPGWEAGIYKCEKVGHVECPVMYTDLNGTLDWGTDE